MTHTLEQLAAKIRPLVKVDGKLHEIKNAHDLDSPIFYTAPEIGDAVSGKLDIILYAHSFTTKHFIIGENIFEPTIEEILSQVPEELIERACAFSVDGKIKCVNRDGSLLHWAGMIYLYGMPRIPAIDDGELRKRADKIKPIVEKDGKRWFIKEPDLRNTAFGWSPEMTEQAGKLVEVKKVTTYHTYGYQGFFKPSIAEVLAQLPEDCLDKVEAFSVAGPEHADDLNQNIQELNEGYHVAETTLYRKAA